MQMRLVYIYLELWPTNYVKYMLEKYPAKCYMNSVVYARSCDHIILNGIDSMMMLSDGGMCLCGFQ